jgi:hypothetical protein
MANDVFANGRELSCKKADGKSICAFPDVCMTPPENPATPPGVPVPYPNTGMATDTTSGSKRVKISGKEVMLRNKSYFKKSVGDEAGSAAKKGILTSVNRGKVYFTSWSVDVKFEGQNVVRHLDLTTHNHGSNSNTVTWPHTDAMAKAFGEGGVCEDMEHLRLQPYNKKCPDNANGKPQTGHHLIPGRCMRNYSGYSHGAAPVICVSRGNQHQGSHKKCHAKFDPVELDHFEKGKRFKYMNAQSAAAASAGGAMNPPRSLSDEEQECVSFQLDQYYKAKPPKGPGCNNSSSLRASGKRGKVIPKSNEPSVGF